ncbi:hypothetical protein [Peribacillus simplex]|uniref:hypothetical protein n=1 Tax=Peribacillus simplex TaxID=1478 RepID=UPI003D26BDA2
MRDLQNCFFLIALIGILGIFAAKRGYLMEAYEEKKEWRTGYGKMIIFAFLLKAAVQPLNRKVQNRMGRS